MSVNTQLEDETEVIILVRSIRFASLDHSCSKILYQAPLLAVYVNVSFHVCVGNSDTIFHM